MAAPPPPPPPAPTSLGSLGGPAPSGGRGALLADIAKGRALRKTEVNDRSAPTVKAGGASGGSGGGGGGGGGVGFQGDLAAALALRRTGGVQPNPNQPTPPPRGSTLGRPSAAPLAGGQAGRGGGMGMGGRGGNAGRGGMMGRGQQPPQQQQPQQQQRRPAIPPVNNNSPTNSPTAQSAQLEELKSKLEMNEEKMKSMEEELESTKEELSETKEKLLNAEQKLESTYEKLAAAENELKALRESKLSSSGSSSRVEKEKDKEKSSKKKSHHSSSKKSKKSDRSEKIEKPEPSSDLYVALFNFVPQNDDDLPFNKGDVLSFVQELDNNWWIASMNGKQGVVPSNYLKKK